MPPTTTTRFWVELISADALRRYMAHRDTSIRQLAARVGCSKDVIGHLHSGARRTCRPETARKIERYLDAPAGSLFAPKVSHVPSNSRTGRGSADLGVVLVLMFAMGIVAATLYGLSWLIAQAPSLSEVGGWIGGVL